MESNKLNINQWAEEDRPREKLARKGPGALSNAELLAILIGSGSGEESAVDLMRRLLSDCDNRLRSLGKMSLPDLIRSEIRVDEETGCRKRVRRYKGLAEAKAVTLLAACELGRRWTAEEAVERAQIRSSVDLYNYFAPRLQHLGHEECHALLMNQANRVVGTLLVGSGGFTATTVDVRLVIREALLHQAPVVALCHNHPSGSTRPSREDDLLTDKLQKACRLMDIRLLDHLVWAEGGFFSYREEGRLDG